MKCPVCQYQLSTVAYYEGYHLFEEHAVCQCGYQYDYLTGAVKEAFGRFEFIEYHNGTKQQNTPLPIWLVVWLWRVLWYLRSM